MKRLDEIFSSTLFLAPFSLLLFLLLFFRNVLVSLLNIINVDENTGVTEVFDYSFSQLIQHGPREELNNSPLYYILDKVWIGLVNYSPHLEWNLRVYFRLMPIFFWVATILAVFLFLRKILSHYLFGGALSFFVSVALSLSLYSNQFFLNQAAENRPYTCWLLLSFLHLMLFTYFFLEGKRSQTLAFALYSLVCLLMSFTVYISVVQVCMGVALYFFLAPKSVERKSRITHLLLGVVCGLVGLYYFSQVMIAPRKFDQISKGWELGREFLLIVSRLDIANHAKVYSIHGNWSFSSLWLKVWALFVFVSPVVFFRPNTKSALKPVIALGYGLVGMVFIYALVVERVGQTLGGVRYLIFLAPYFFTFTIVSLWILWQGFLLLPFVKRGKNKLGSILAFSFSFFLLAEVYEMHRWDLKRIFELSSKTGLYSLLEIRQTSAEKCPKDMREIRHEIKNAIDLESINNLCR